jgi:hypothetical protein
MIVTYSLLLLGLGYMVIEINYLIGSSMMVKHSFIFNILIDLQIHEYGAKVRKNCVIVGLIGMHGFQIRVFGQSILVAYQIYVILLFSKQSAFKYLEIVLLFNSLSCS